MIEKNIFLVASAGTAVAVLVAGLSHLADKPGLPTLLFCVLFTVLWTVLAYYNRIRSLNTVNEETKKYCVVSFFVGFLHFASASALAGLAQQNESEWEGPVTVTSTVWIHTNTSDDTCSPKSPCYLDVQIEKLENTLPVATLAVLFGLISGTGHMLVCLMSVPKVEEFTKSVTENGKNWLRWADYALSASTMIVELSKYPIMFS